MFVIKRNGRQERVQFDKITSRITKLAYNLNTQFVDPGACALGFPSPNFIRSYFTMYFLTLKIATVFFDFISLQQ